MPIPASAQPARAAEPCSVVIFGASGDLTQRKLVPALYNLRHDRLLPDGCALVGFARRPKSDAQFRDDMRGGVADHSRSSIDAAVWEAFAAGARYHKSDLDDRGGYRSLRALLDELDVAQGVARGAGNRLFYLATPPEAYPRIVARLGEAGLNGPPPSQRESAGWTR